MTAAQISNFTVLKATSGIKSAVKRRHSLKQELEAVYRCGVTGALCRTKLENGIEETGGGSMCVSVLHLCVNDRLWVNTFVRSCIGTCA